MLDAPARELIEIIQTLRNNSEKATYSNICSNIRGFRSSGYVSIRLRKLVERGYIERVNGEYRVVENPPITVEEIANVDERDFRVAAFHSDIIYLILGIVQQRPEDVPALTKAVKETIPYEVIKQAFLEMNIVYRLAENPALIPRIYLPNKKIPYEKFEQDLIELFKMK